MSPDLTQKNGSDKTHRVFPKNKVAGILECQIARPVESFANVAALSDLSPCFVFLLLRSPHLAETNFDIGRELQSWSVEGTRFLFGKPSLVLRVIVSSSTLPIILKTHKW